MGLRGLHGGVVGGVVGGGVGEGGGGGGEGITEFHNPLLCARSKEGKQLSLRQQ